MNPRWMEIIETQLHLIPDSLGAGSIDQAVTQRQTETAMDADEYIEFLGADANEQNALAQLLTVPETWFFRHAATFCDIRDTIQRKRAGLSAATPLRMLSMPCASGEEPYSLAMLCDDVHLPAGHVVIDAIDIDAASLALAAQGDYSDNSLRETDPYIQSLQDRYLPTEDDGLRHHRVDPAIRPRVRFQRVDALAIGALHTEGQYDVILCRNFMIYIAPTGREKLFAMLHRLLKPDGICYTGTGERLPAEHFSLSENRLAYVHTPQPAPPVAPKCSPTPLATRRKRVPPVAPADPTHQVDAPEPMSLEAIEAMADAGELTGAESACQEWTQRSPGDVAGWLLLGVIRHATQQHEAAEQCFQRVLYLDANHADALHWLAMLAEQRGDAAASQRYEQRRTRQTQEVTL
jgi:chemotaxis protein methyltransferase WspC